MGQFSGVVSGWVSKSKQRITAVRNMAVEKVVEFAQTPVGAGGNMPIDTGFLRASLFVTTTGALPAKTENPGGGSFTYTGGDLVLTLANASMDDVVTVGWSAAYARHVEYGARGRAGRKFRDLAAQRWPEAVRDASLELERTVTARAGR